MRQLHCLIDAIDAVAEEGWEGMDDADMPLHEDATAVEPESVPVVGMTTAVEAEAAAGSDGDQGEESGDQPVSEGPCDDDNNEGWEDMENLSPSPEAAEAAVQEAPAESETVTQAESQQVNQGFPGKRMFARLSLHRVHI